MGSFNEGRRRRGSFVAVAVVLWFALLPGQGLAGEDAINLGAASLKLADQLLQGEQRFAEELTPKLTDAMQRYGALQEQSATVQAEWAALQGPLKSAKTAEEKRTLGASALGVFDRSQGVCADTDSAAAEILGLADQGIATLQGMVAAREKLERQPEPDARPLAGQFKRATSQNLEAMKKSRASIAAGREKVRAGCAQMKALAAAVRRGVDSQR